MLCNLLESHRQTKSRPVCTLLSGIIVLGLALATPAAGMSAGSGGGGGGAGAGGGGGGTVHRLDQSDLTTCPQGLVWDTEHNKCLKKHGGGGE